MKKNWIAPELENLDISATAGGSKYSTYIDKEWFNTEANAWEHWYGEEDGIS